MTDYGMLQITTSEQALLLLFAVLLGAAAGLVYSIIQIFRLAVPCNKAVCFFQDVVYFIVCAIATFLFMLVFNKGIVRGYLITAGFIGALIYFATLGRILMFFSNAIIQFVRKILLFVLRHLVLPFKYLYNFFTRKVKAILTNLKARFSVKIPNKKIKSKIAKKNQK